MVRVRQGQRLCCYRDGITVKYLTIFAYRKNQHKGVHKDHVFVSRQVNHKELDSLKTYSLYDLYKLVCFDAYDEQIVRYLTVLPSL